jgi:hypothetical protein
VLIPTAEINSKSDRSPKTRGRSVMIRTKSKIVKKQQSEFAPDATFLMEILGALLVLTFATGGMVFALL